MPTLTINVGEKYKFHINNELSGTFVGRISNDIPYTVLDIQSSMNIVSSNMDIYNNMFAVTPMMSRDSLLCGRVYDEYINSLKSTDSIITLTSDGIDRIYIPNRVLEQVTPSTGAIYKEKTFTINLGLLPDQIDMESLKDTLSDTIEYVIGKRPGIRYTETSVSVVIPKEKDILYKDMLLNANSTHGLLGARYRRALSKIVELEEKINIYESYLT